MSTIGWRRARGGGGGVALQGALAEPLSRNPPTPVGSRGLKHLVEGVILGSSQPNLDPKGRTALKRAPLVACYCFFLLRVMCFSCKPVSRTQGVIRTLRCMLSGIPLIAKKGGAHMLVPPRKPRGVCPDGCRVSPYFEAAEFILQPFL